MLGEKQQLLTYLHSPDPDTRDDAVSRLWQLFYGAAGPEAELRLVMADQATERGAYDEACRALDALIDEYPDFAEAWNRRATLNYIRRRYEDAIDDCRVVVELEPDHFGAWYGLGACYLALNQHAPAARAFRRALEIEPFSELNQKSFEECLTRLN